MPTFEKLGFVVIERKKIHGVNGPSTYTVIRNAKPLRTVTTPCRRATTSCNAQSRSLEESLEESLENTHHSDEWRYYYSNDGLEKIDLYNQICVPRGWFPVNAHTEDLQDALAECEYLDPDEWRLLLIEAADQREAGDQSYNTPRGAKLIRICWNNWNRSDMPF
jgi:hypothetical protein